MVETTMEFSSWLRKQLEQASPDLLRGMVQEFAEALMGAEGDALCGAPYGERVGFINSIALQIGQIGRPSGVGEPRTCRWSRSITAATCCCDSAATSLSRSTWVSRDTAPTLRQRSCQLSSGQVSAIATAAGRADFRPRAVLHSHRPRVPGRATRLPEHRGRNTRRTRRRSAVGSQFGRAREGSDCSPLEL